LFRSSSVFDLNRTLAMMTCSTSDYSNAISNHAKGENTARYEKKVSDGLESKFFI